MTATLMSARVLGVATAISAAAVVAGPPTVAVPGGLLLAFVMPGMALTGVVFRRHELSAVERIILAPALSLATLIVAGLLMNAAGIELDRTAWTSATAGVTLLALFAAVLPARGDGAGAGAPAAGSREPAFAAAGAARAAVAAVRTGAPRPAAFSPDDTVRLVVVPPLAERKKAPNPDAPTPDAPTPDGAATAATGGDGGEPGSGGGRSLVRRLLPLVLAVLVAGGAAWLSYDSSRTSFAQTVTTLSADPPSALSAAGTHAVRVTAEGLVPADGPYAIEVRGGTGRRLERRTIAPVDGAWTADLTVPGRERVTIDLLRADESTPYRTLVIAAVG